MPRPPKPVPPPFNYSGMEVFLALKLEGSYGFSFFVKDKIRREKLMFKAEQYIGDSKEVMILYFYQPFESWKYFLFHLRHKFNIIDELLPDSITTLKLEKDEQISI